MNAKKIAAASISGLMAILIVAVVFCLATQSASASFSRSSGSSVTRTVSLTKKSTAEKAVTKSAAVKPKPYYGSHYRDDVECGTLRNSRHPADREVFRRYCL